jgi:hypothetical protein
MRSLSRHFQTESLFELDQDAFGRAQLDGQR